MISENVCIFQKGREQNCHSKTGFLKENLKQNITFGYHFGYQLVITFILCSIFRNFYIQNFRKIRLYQKFRNSRNFQRDHRIFTFGYTFGFLHTSKETKLVAHPPDNNMLIIIMFPRNTISSIGKIFCNNEILKDNCIKNQHISLRKQVNS